MKKQNKIYTWAMLLCMAFGFITSLLDADQEFDELAKAIADTFSQLVLCISFDKGE